MFDVIAIHPYTFEPPIVLRAVQFARRELPRRRLRAAAVADRGDLVVGPAARARAPPLRDDTARPGRQLTQVFPLLLRNRRELGIERIYWESWLSTDRDHRNPFNSSGLRGLDRDGTVREKPAFAAFRRVGLELKRPLSPAE